MDGAEEGDLHLLLRQLVVRRRTLLDDGRVLDPDHDGSSGLRPALLNSAKLLTANNVAGVMEILHFVKSRRGGELIGIVILAAGLSLGAALITYHPDDSSAFYTSTNNAISNAIGYYGATVAWIFVGFFGFASLLFPLGMLVIGWQRFWDQEVEYVQTKAFGWVTLLIAVPPLLDLTFGKVWLRGALIASGGYLGQEIDQAAITNLNRGGSAILFGTMLLVGILLSTRISLAAIFIAIKENLVGLSRTLTLQWARLTERRRKEKM